VSYDLFITTDVVLLIIPPSYEYIIPLLENGASHQSIKEVIASVNHEII